MNFGFGFPGMYGMVNPREQTLAHLKAIRSHKQSIANAKVKVERLEQEKLALIKERDGYQLKNTHDTSHASRVQAQTEQGIKDIWKTMRKAESITNLVLFLTTLVALAFVVFLVVDQWAWLTRNIDRVVWVFSIFEGFYIYLLFMFLFNKICVLRIYERYQPEKSGWVTFTKVRCFVLITLSFFYMIAVDQTEITVGCIALLYQVPIWVCAIMVKMICFIALKCVYRKCDRRERDYKWQMKKELNQATETDSQEKASYAKENDAWIAKRKSTYAPKIAAKEKEIDDAKVALRQLPGCASYQLYPFLEKESIDYISELIGLVEGGRADTVKEAVNLQSQIVDQRSRDWEARERAKDLAKQQREADERMQAEARRVRVAEEERAEAAKKQAEELEKIRRNIEDT